MKNSKNYFSKISGVIGLSVVSCVAYAQATPDAGSLLRQTERDLNPQRAPAAQVRREVLKSSVVKPGETTVMVAQFKFVGNTMLSDAQLQAAVAPYLNQALTFAQLQQVTDAATNAYREAGWLVRTFLPAQKITNGVFTIQVEEAVFGKVVLVDAPQRVDAAVLKGFVDAAQVAGAPLSAKKIDRALLLLGDLPGVIVAGNLIEGEKPSETDILIKAVDGSALAGNVSVDNYGSRSTGVERVLASLNINGPLQLGDQLGLTALKTQGSDYQRVGFTLPVGYDGLRAGAHATHLSYGLVGDFASMGSNGSSLSTGLDVSYPLLRSQPTNINLMANYEQKRFDNNNLSGSVSHYNIDVYSIGVNANQLDNWDGGGMSNASATLTTGQVNLDGSANQSTDTNGPATAGNFAKLSLSLSRLQKLDTTLSAYVAVNMQMANKNLDSSERMYLGGASGVRAYPSSEGGGSQGNTFTAELRQQLNSHYTVTGFYDRGHVQAFKNNAYADGTAHLNSGSTSNNYSLSGYGVSLAWQSHTGTELRATIARRIGTSPLANTTSGNDGDGTRKFNRLWLNASVNF